MPQNMMEDQCSQHVPGSPAREDVEPRALTHDEKKAAEAAFRGEPFNPTWSGAAAKVYAGVVSAMAKRAIETSADIEHEYISAPSRG